MRSQHFAGEVKIPTCSALYRKIFASTGSASEAADGHQQEALGTLLWLHSGTGTCAFLAGSRALKAHTTSHWSALRKRNVLLNWGLGRSLFAFLLLKSIWTLNRCPGRIKRLCSGAAVSFLGAESTSTDPRAKGIQNTALSQGFWCSALLSAQAVTLLYHRLHLTLKV